MDEKEVQAASEPAASGEEFEILELEDRLELTNRCNYNCSCPTN